MAAAPQTPRAVGELRPARRLIVVLIYLSGVVQGLALVTFPAASTIFTSPEGFHLTSAGYGNLFLPQVGLAIAAAASGPWLTRKLGLPGVLLVGLGADFASMLLLAASPLVAATPLAYPLLCSSTAALGLGFGAAVPALNTAVEALFPAGADGAVLALNALLGLGTALAPVLVALCSALGAWWLLPLAMAVASASLVIPLAMLRPAIGEAAQAAPSAEGLPLRFWLYSAATLLYGIVETLSGNWAVLYLSAERHLAGATASIALTAFWLATTLGRVLFAALSRIVPSRLVYVALPGLLAISFQVVSGADSAIPAIATFAAAGLACSALLPLSISLGGAEFPQRAATMSGELIAFYQIGYGLAAFGVGPLHDRAGLSYASLYSLGSLFALALASVSVLISRRR